MSMYGSEIKHDAERLQQRERERERKRGREGGREGEREPLPASSRSLEQCYLLQLLPSVVLCTVLLLELHGASYSMASSCV